MKFERLLLILVMGIQVLCAVFFVSDILLTILGIGGNPIRWQTRELLEIGAALGLIMGVLIGVFALRRSLAHRDEAVESKEKAEESLRSVQLAFRDHVEERFRRWELTAAERDVALFTIKGMSVAEIAELRSTSEGTVKAQSAGIYRKSGVKNRTQLVSLFIDDLIEQDS